MAQDDIQGQVVDAQGNPVSGAIVELTKSYQSSPDTRGDVFRTTTDSNGNYIFTGHQEGDGTTQEWHVSCYNHDGSAYVNSFNNPGVTADLPSNAIPDSVVTQHDATTESSTGGITTISDLVGSRDLSGSASVISDGINAQQSYRFDGTDDLMTESAGSEFAAASDDFAFLFVAQQQEPSTTDAFYVDGGEDLEFGLQDNNNDVFRVYRNSGSFNGTSSLGADQEAHLFLVESVGTSDVRLEVDGSEVATNTNQDGGLIGHTLGGRANDSDHLQVDIGQFEILVNYTSSELSDREQELSDKWGITL